MRKPNGRLAIFFKWQEMVAGDVLRSSVNSRVILLRFHSMNFLKASWLRFDEHLDLGSYLSIKYCQNETLKTSFGLGRDSIYPTPPLGSGAKHFNRDLGDEQAVYAMGHENTDFKAQTEKGWYFQNTSDFPTSSEWGLKLFERPMYRFDFMAYQPLLVI